MYHFLLTGGHLRSNHFLRGAIKILNLTTSSIPSESLVLLSGKNCIWSAKNKASLGVLKPNSLGSDSIILHIIVVPCVPILEPYKSTLHLAEYLAFKYRYNQTILLCTKFVHILLWVLTYYIVTTMVWCGQRIFHKVPCSDGKKVLFWRNWVRNSNTDYNLWTRHRSKTKQLLTAFVVQLSKLAIL